MVKVVWLLVILQVVQSMVSSSSSRSLDTISNNKELEERFINVEERFNDMVTKQQDLETELVQLKVTHQNEMNSVSKNVEN